MDVREKLIEILEEPCGGLYPACELADYLISNGVTVQEWISVDDRLPETGEYVVCIAKKKSIFYVYANGSKNKENGWVNPITEQYISEVTHWMPMPDPPKGE